MGYSPREHVEDCKAGLAWAKLLAKHYPKARREKIGGRLEWCDDGALANTTGFSVEVMDRFTVSFHPYHELSEGDVRGRVYATWSNGCVLAWEVMDKIVKNPALHGAILALLKEQR
jgi:hypothetical protein